MSNQGTESHNCISNTYRAQTEKLSMSSRSDLSDKAKTKPPKGEEKLIYYMRNYNSIKKVKEHKAIGQMSKNMYR